MSDNATKSLSFSARSAAAKREALLHIPVPGVHVDRSTRTRSEISPAPTLAPVSVSVLEQATLPTMAGSELPAPAPGREVFSATEASIPIMAEAREILALGEGEISSPTPGAS